MTMTREKSMLTSLADRAAIADVVAAVLDRADVHLPKGRIHHHHCDECPENIPYRDASQIHTYITQIYTNTASLSTPKPTCTYRDPTLTATNPTQPKAMHEAQRNLEYTYIPQYLEGNANEYIRIIGGQQIL
jgi:hypothetical protein